MLFSSLSPDGRLLAIQACTLFTTTVVSGLLLRWLYNQRKEMMDLARISDPAPPTHPEFFTQTTEDMIPEETLEVLAFSPNLDMAEAAKRLILERVKNRPRVWDTLISNVLERNGRSQQEEGLIVLKYYYLQQRQILPQRERTLRAIVTALTKRLPEVEARQLGPRDDTDWKLRTEGEKDALYILRCEAEAGPENLLETTGLVAKWLAKYPFGGKHASREKKMKVVQRLLGNRTDDESLGRLLMAIFYDDKSALGRKQLRAAGLIRSVMREEGMEEDGSQRVLGAIATAGFDASGNRQLEGVTLHEPLETPGEHENESEEARLRRRRRNTVVTENLPPPAEDSPAPA